MDDYKAQWDAKTLAEAENIKDDPNRLTAAKTAAEKMAKDQADKTRNLRKVAGNGRRSGGNGGAPKTNRQSNKGGQGANSYNVFKRI